MIPNTMTPQPRLNRTSNDTFLLVSILAFQVTYMAGLARTNLLRDHMKCTYWYRDRHKVCVCDGVASHQKGHLEK